MDFKKADGADGIAIARLEAEIFSDPWSERSVTDCLVSTGNMCYVAKEDGEVVAYVLGRVIPPEGELYRVAVIPRLRRRGIAYRLLDYAVKCERGRGLEILFLEVRRHNAAAIALYRAYGFREMGVRKNYYRDPPDDALIFVHANAADLKN